VIRKDIPIVSNLRFDDIERIDKTLEFIGKSEVDGINFSSISKNLGITKYKAELFVTLLAQAFILNPVYPLGTNVLKEPKVLMFLPFRLLTGIGISVSALSVKTFLRRWLK
jgi:predicted AAA+ superfamily ATPase